jgi:hypothetical protein
MKPVLLILLLTVSATGSAFADPKTEAAFKALSDIAKASSGTAKAIAQNIR